MIKEKELFFASYITIKLSYQMKEREKKNKRRCEGEKKKNDFFLLPFLSLMVFYYSLFFMYLIFLSLSLS
jgi:hypothetical protein